MSDYLAATITGDSGMGRGFFQSNEPLRQIDPPGREHVWPDDLEGEVHADGLIIGGALWDMRQDLVDRLGEEGVPIADRIWYQAMRRAVDIPTMYFEALAADDDDGDLSNGTPHICSINAGFAPHGLRKVSAQGGRISVAPPHLDAYTVSLGLIGMHQECESDNIGNAEVTWRLRDDEATGGTLPMTLGSTGFEAQLPTQPDGSVVQYRVSMSLGTGATQDYPDNAADRWYEMFIGHVEPIYCTDFETDPAADGWSHGLLSGDNAEGADDWQWGAPQAPSDSGDPRRAWSGDNAYGNDLGIGEFNGQYQSDKTNYSDSPNIDTSGYDSVRLQYRRWLTIEDAHFDRGAIYVNGQLAWQNLDSDQGSSSDTHHIDREWRFHDIDISEHVDSDNVVMRWEMSSDQGFTLGGWTLDDVCVVGYVPTVCGDGRITGMEQCDDGTANADVADTCRADCTLPSCGDGIVDAGEICDDGNVLADDGCEADCTLLDGGTRPPGTRPAPGAGDGVVPTDGSCGCGTSPSHGDQRWLLLLAGLSVLGLRRRRLP